MIRRTEPTRSRAVWLAAVLGLVAACTSSQESTPTSTATPPPPTAVPLPTSSQATTTTSIGPDSSALPLSAIDGATTPTSFVLAIDVPGATSARLVIDGEFIGKDETAPLEFEVSVEPGEHELKVRTAGADDDRRVAAAFTATDSATSPPSTTVTTLGSPASTAPPTVAGQNGSATSPATSVVDTVDEIRAALAEARPGDVIEVADGEYLFRPRLVASASGTASAPITLRGTRAAMLRTKNASGDYGVHVTGDHWRIEGLTVAHGSKGIVLDGSLGTVIDGVEVFDIGAEAVHFRNCSSDGVLRNSYIHHTGRTHPQYGEGVYVGSANSNWSDFACTDPVEQQSEGDNTERTLIEGNTFEDITAEGADLKEGTDSGTLRNNVFRRSGTSGANSADSAVDAKGNNWVIEGNTVAEGDADWDDDGTMRPSEFLDGMQTHSVYDGYGTGNVFRANTIVGPLPGFAVGLSPADGNVVTCDNRVDDATGLVGEHGKEIPCGPRPL